MSDRGVRQRLLDSAVQLFSERGFAGASTREIARLAEVNETSLFRLFGSKEELFWAALESQLKDFRLPKQLQQLLAENAAPRLVLPQFIEFVVRTAAYQPQVIRLLIASIMELRPQAEMVHRKALAPIYQTIVDYLANCISSGSMRSLDPKIATIALAATVLTQQRLAHVLTGAAALNAEDAVNSYSSFWLKALLPTELNEVSVKTVLHS